MYWKATLYELPGVEKIDLPVDREYYGYVDEEVYPDWDSEVAKEIFLYLEEKLAPENAFGDKDYSKLAVLSNMNIDVETVSKEEYDLKTSEI